jgi:hypothetical protein
LSGPSFLAGGIILNGVCQFSGFHPPWVMRELPLLRGATRTDQVSALEVEAIELIACLLGVVYVLVDYECCAL